MERPGWFQVIRAVFFFLIIVSGLTAMAYSLQAARIHRDWCEAHAPSAAAKQQSRKILGTVSFHLYKGDRREDERLRILQDQETAVSRQADQASLLVLLLVLLMFGIHGIRVYRNRLLLEAMLHDLLLVALFILIVGLVTPVLRLEAADRYLGQDVVFKAETKSILGTVQTLFASGNGVVASLVFLFSLFIPLLKVVYGFRALDQRPEARRGAVRFLTLAGKWSMVDVFVIANLLAVFTINRLDDLTDARVGHGTWFFAGYCLLSLMAGVGLAALASDEKPDL